MWILIKLGMNVMLLEASISYFLILYHEQDP